MNKLVIKDLCANADGKEILKGVNLEINSGEVHVIMGPNGTGKSTLASVIMGHPKYEVTSGSIHIDGQDVLAMEVDERAKAGLFLGMQYPSEISGITNSDFLRSAMKASEQEDESLIKYIKRLETSVDELKMDKDMPQRYLNVNFSGGEKKKNEILQMAMLKPKIAILDEIDSGLDIDALNVVGTNLTKQMELRENELSLLLITHYQRLLDYIKPTHVHIMMDGIIVKTGGYELVDLLETEGYDAYRTETTTSANKTDNQRPVAGNCAKNVVGDNNGNV